jgi:group I intron endonuclease
MEELDYSNGKIYQIKNKITKEKYIGSTVNSLEDRFRGHTSKINIDSEKNRKLYVAMKEHGIQNFSIKLVEEYSCQSKKELRLREAHYIMLFDTIENGYNMNLPIVDVDEKTYKHDWYESNKERILEMRKTHYEKNREAKIAYQLEYAKENATKIAEYQKNYRIEYDKNNQDKLKAKRQVRMDCPFCGKDYTKINMTTHFKLVHKYTGSIKSVATLTDEDYKKIANLTITPGASTSAV